MGVEGIPVRLGIERSIEVVEINEGILRRERRAIVLEREVKVVIS